MGDASKPGRIPAFMAKLYQHIVVSLQTHQQFATKFPSSYFFLLLNLIRVPYAVGFIPAWADLVDLLLSSLNVRLHESLIRRCLLLFKLAGVLTPEMEKQFEDHGHILVIAFRGAHPNHIEHIAALTHIWFVHTPDSATVRKPASQICI